MDINYVVPESLIPKEEFNSVKVKHQISKIDEILRNDEDREAYRLKDSSFIGFEFPFLSHSGETLLTADEFAVLERFFLSQGWTHVNGSISRKGISGIVLSYRPV